MVVSKLIGLFKVSQSSIFPRDWWHYNHLGWKSAASFKCWMDWGSNSEGFYLAGTEKQFQINLLQTLKEGGEYDFSGKYGLPQYYITISLGRHPSC